MGNTSGGPNGDGTHPCDGWGIQEYEIERLRLLAEVRELKLQQRIHIGTIRDLQCGALNYLTYPHDAEKQGLDSAVMASLCIVPLEDDESTASGSPTQELCPDCGHPRDLPSHCSDPFHTKPADDSRRDPLDEILKDTPFKMRDKHDYQALYYELIMEVANKWPDETRHETAKRYIVEREAHDPNACASAESGHGPTEDGQ